MARTGMSPALRKGPANRPKRSLDETRAIWLEAFRRVRAETERRASHLSAEDQIVQSMADASPAKWHRAHVTWFFEQFLLVPHDAAYRVFDERFPFLFNSYYVAAGPRHARPQRGLITRPNGAEVAAYRAHVDAAVERLMARVPAEEADSVFTIVEIGLHHEQQHQELLLTDILHAFAQNPTDPVYDPKWQPPRMTLGPRGYVDVPAGVHAIGHDGDGFCFDNEMPPHDELIPRVRIARHLVTNADWLEFISAGGYTTPSLWLSDGWTTVQNESWQAPGYWRQKDGAWHAVTLGGLRPVDPAAPVQHVSYYEADAFARFAGKHLPSEMEWETAARHDIIADAFGIAWQWTRSAYLPYPGYRAVEGALGEYNGKFMVSQMVLRGSSLATPEGHERVSYRNFFYPPTRWQFSGLRLAEFI
ncbi:MAG TPA: ergothioneine biosynthesis protein EgtB [Pseudolabrys sp.]|jgi:ergothioneine biosynthesis protein EgtB|nr:ergothioneine biosynthesis protein EgtB [Pseudolabrys sp.]